MSILLHLYIYLTAAPSTLLPNHYVYSPTSLYISERSPKHTVPSYLTIMSILLHLYIYLTGAPSTLHTVPSSTLLPNHYVHSPTSLYISDRSPKHTVPSYLTIMSILLHLYIYLTGAPSTQYPPT